MMKFFLVIFLIPLSYSLGENLSQVDPAFGEYAPGIGHKIIFHDLSYLDFEVLEVKKILHTKVD